MLLCDSPWETCYRCCLSLWPNPEPLVSPFHLCRALLAPPALLDLLAQAVVVTTLVLMETSTGLTSLAHQLLSDPRIMKLMLLWSRSTTRLRPFLLQKALGRTQLAHAETWDSATRNGAVVGWDTQSEWPFSQVRPFQVISPWELEWNGIWVKMALCEILPVSIFFFQPAPSFKIVLIRVSAFFMAIHTLILIFMERRGRTVKFWK